VRCFRAAVAAGAVPFTVQGSENGLAIEGGRTLGWEIADELVAGRRAADRLLVQVGGGALASACAAALRDAVRSGRLHRTPRLHPVQTAGGHPLERAYSRVVERAYREADETLPPDAPGVAEHLRRRFDGAAVRRALTRAATHRSEFMWPWETPPVSLAEGILDDETYDWRAVVEGTLQSGGWPVVVDEDDVRRANELLREHTAAPSSFTGSAGVAGALRLARERALGPEETVVVLATGRRRDTSAV
jgi:threonine synthase